MELEGGGAIGAPGGCLQCEGQGERVEARRRRGWRGKEAPGEEEKRARGVGRCGEASEGGVEVIGGRRREGAEEEECVGQRSGVVREREAVEEAGAEGGVKVEDG